MSTRDLLRLTLTPGLGPVLIARLLAAFGSAEAALAASAADLERIKGIGRGKSASFVRGMKEAAALVDDELALADKLGVTLIPRADPLYPPHLRAIADAPPILYCKGRFDPGAAHQYPVAIVGSRSATAYGIEQSERFASTLAASGLTIVSGGARGIDTAAHRGALRAGGAAGRTIAVLGCGLANCYPPENQPLFDQIAASGGAVMSELPLRTNPEADNFPARNRLISGISLGIIVIEAGKRSGSLITARLAAEDHGREVMAVPGRVDSPASAGTHDLLKQGGAALVTDPGDVLALLETPARHSFEGSFEARYADPAAPLFEAKPAIAASSAQAMILQALASPRTMDELAADTGMEIASLRSELTLLEIQRRVRREGSRVARVGK